MTAYAFGLGVGTQNSRGEWLEVFYPAPLLSPGDALAQCIDSQDTPQPLDGDALRTLAARCRDAGEGEIAALAEKLAGGTAPCVAVLLSEDRAPADVPSAYLKLHLLSHRLVPPHGTNLEGLFGLLKNVAWTSRGAIDPEELPERQLSARLAGETLEVSCVDKFPKMTNYVVPPGVRIAHTARVRLGAHLGEGTTVMHEGFINFNAGTDGPGHDRGPHLRRRHSSARAPISAAAAPPWGHCPAVAIS
jgi:2,3,4,5-tetrahydropyridine-2-carboxylate N-succinyltransferase